MKQWPKLHDWPILLSNFKEIFSDISPVDITNASTDSSDTKTGIVTGFLKKLFTLFTMKTWVKISINFTLAAMHLAYLINSNFHEVCGPKK
jgi:hypothetical protein